MDGKEIRKVRKLKGMSSEKLGSLVGVSGRSIQLYETTSRNPKLKTEVEICKVLEIPLSDRIKDILSSLPDDVLTQELCNRGYKIREKWVIKYESK